jgi:hypothetical protein
MRSVFKTSVLATCTLLAGILTLKYTLKVQTFITALVQGFPDFKHLHTPFRMSALQAYPLSQLHLNLLIRKRSNEIMIKLQAGSKKKL